MHWFLVAGILLAAAGPTLAMSLSKSEIEELLIKEATPIMMAEFLNVVRDKIGKEEDVKFNNLKLTESLKVPEVQCERNYAEDTEKLIKELIEKYPSDEQKQEEEAETVGDDTLLSCFLPSRTEVNCKWKECEGSKNPKALCVCGPKKCKLDSDGLCDKKGSKDGDDEKDGSSSLFVVGTMLNLTIFYLISSFF